MPPVNQFAFKLTLFKRYFLFPGSDREECLLEAVRCMVFRCVLMGSTLVSDTIQQLRLAHRHVCGRMFCLLAELMACYLHECTLCW